MGKLCTFLFVCVVTVFGQTQARPVTVVDLSSAPNLPAQPVGVNDLIGIAVYDSPELTRTVRVDADGTIQLPMLQAPLKVAGLLPREMESALTKRLQDDGLILEPLVKVTVVEYYSRPISVLGAVRKPVTFQALGPVTLVEALARAEGLNEVAGREIVVSNPHSAGPPRHILVKDLMETADPAANLKLTGGEEIRVPEAARIFVMGNVKKPGAFPVRDSAEFTVLKAIALAEGLAPFPGKMAYIYRKDAAAGSVELPVELTKLLKRQAPDVELLPNDILYVPDNNTKRLTAATIEKLILFGSTAGATALVWRR